MSCLCKLSTNPLASSRTLQLIHPRSLPSLLPLQTAQQSLEVAQEACNDLDLRAASAEAAARQAGDDAAAERARLEERLAQVWRRSGC